LPPHAGASGFLEEISVDTLDYICLLILYTYVVPNHQAAQHLAVDQDDPGRNPVRILNRAW
jgi:hypothetical protein